MFRLTLPPSLAATWLIPRLGEFKRTQPDIDLQLITSTRFVDLRQDQVNLFIRHGKGAWSSLDGLLMMGETAMPVCAPGNFTPLEGAPTPDLFQSIRLIVSTNFPGEWEEWARAHGIKTPSLGDSITMEAVEQGLLLAENGHGLAIGRRTPCRTVTHRNCRILARRNLNKIRVTLKRTGWKLRHRCAIF